MVTRMYRMYAVTSKMTGKYNNLAKLVSGTLVVVLYQYCTWVYSFALGTSE